MAKHKQKHKAADAATITPPEDAPQGDQAFSETESGMEGGGPGTGMLAGEPGTPGEYDPRPALSDELPPLGTPAETDPPTVDAQVVATLTSLEPEEVPAPLDSPRTPETGYGTDAPGGSAGTGDPTPAPSGKGGRYDTPEKRAERNRKERERQARKRAQADQAAGKVAQATNVARKAQAAVQAPAKAPQVAAVAAPLGVDLDTMLGLSFHAIALAVPEKWGGGTLTAAERELLGKAWAAPLAPYLSGAAGPWAVAAISTVQVFAIRAMQYTPPSQDARPAQGHVREVGTQAEPRPQVVASEPALDGIAPAVSAPKRETQQEPGVGGGD